MRSVRGVTGYGLCLLISRTVERPGLKQARQLYAPVAGVSAVDLLATLLAQPPHLMAFAQQWGVEATTLRRWLDEQRAVRVITPADPPQVCVPVFGPKTLAEMAPVCAAVAQPIASWMERDVLLEPLLERCSFAHCPRPAVLCMLWHNSYYEATDRLIAQGVLPAFPHVAEGDWGVWLTSDPYGWTRASMNPTG
jgi:hypothetical protein